MGRGSQTPASLHPSRSRPTPAQRAWQRTVRWDSHGKELVRYVAELELGNAYGPTCGIRLVAATLDPSKLDPDNTWSLATSLSMSDASPEQVSEIYRLRDWISIPTSQPSMNWAGPITRCGQSRPSSATGIW